MYDTHMKLRKRFQFKFSNDTIPGRKIIHTVSNKFRQTGLLIIIIIITPWL
jgi:hypothetical protein